MVSYKIKLFCMKINGTIDINESCYVWWAIFENRTDIFRVVENMFVIGWFSVFATYEFVLENAVSMFSEQFSARTFL